MLRRIRQAPVFLLPLTAIGLSILLLLGIKVAEVGARAERQIGVTLEQQGAALMVTGVQPDGPADQGGIAAGDLLLTVNGTTVATLADYDAAAQAFTRGEPIRFKLRRSESPVEVAVRPGTTLRWLPSLSSSAAVVLCLVVGAACLAGRRRDVRCRLLATILFLIAFEFALPEGLAANSAWRYVGDLAFYFLTGAQAALELHLAAVIGDPHRSSRRRSAFVLACYAFGGTVAVGGALVWLLAEVGRTVGPFSLEAVDGFILQVVFPVWAIGLVLLLARAALTATTRLGRAQATLVLLGILPWAAFTIADWAGGYPDPTPPALEILLPFLVLFYPAAVFVAIFRYRLFDLPHVVRRSLLYTGLTSSVVLLFYAALGAGGAVVSRVVQGEHASVWSMSLATLILGLLIAPLRRASGRVIERWLYPERNALRGRLIELASELPAQGKLDRMGEHLVRSLRQILGTTSATLLLTEPSSGALYRLARSPRLTQDGEQTLYLPPEDPALVRLRSARRPLPGWDVLERSPTLEGRIGKRGVELAVPLFQEARLVGLLLIGRRLTRERFTSEEVELLSLVAHQVATVLENVRLFQSATYEGLTGLLRREAALEILDAEIDRARRYDRPLTVALADIDHFKQVNDRFGHLQGDRALRVVAAALQSVIRSSDTVSRYGGEEFLLIFPETDIAAAGDLSEKLRRTIEELELAAEDGTPLELRVSIGIAALSDLAAEAATGRLIAAADRELYRAKAGGRNRVEPRGRHDRPVHAGRRAGATTERRLQPVATETNSGASVASSTSAPISSSKPRRPPLT